MKVREGWVDVAGLLAIKVAAGLYALHAGFSHVSDDDYARTFIAEQFAHAPRLDPSGTSWLPFPFWITGGAMAALGSTLAVARLVAAALGALSVAAPYAAMRAVGVERLAALAATAIAMLLPWNVWLAVAMVPEGWTGAVAGASLVAMASERAMPWSAAGLLAAALSRYEVWPACAVFALLVALRAARAADAAVRRRAVAFGLVAIAGPLLWMAWNAHAHGSALHFVARVTSFRRAHGAAQMTSTEKGLAYPRALLAEAPEAALCACLAIGALASRADMRRRWGWCAAACLAIVAFLVVGDLRDGAPTHHPVRALTPVFWPLAAIAADAVATWIRAWPAGAGRVAASGLAALGAIWAITLPPRWADAPGRTEWDRREPQIARGLAMRAADVASATITPCAYEHFALLAAWGRPDRARVLPSIQAPPTADCPHVVEP